MDTKDNSKRIVFLIGSMGKGGAERVISILANYYAEKGWQVDILLLLHNCCEYSLNENIRIIPICIENKSRIAQLPKWMYNIRKYVKKEKPDKIVSFIARINIIAILSCVGLNKSLIISERNDPSADGRSVFVRLATQLLYPFARCIVFQTRWAQSCFSKKIQRKSLVIPNPIHITTLASSSTEMKIVSVGRLIEQKNHSMLIHAFKKVHECFPGYRLVIYGEGKLRSELELQIQELKLEKFVSLPGNVLDIHEKLANAEVFVLSSNYEGLSNALLEAMMMGLPSISTDCAGSNEIIIDNYNGRLVGIGKQDQLADAICDTIKNKEKAQKYSVNGRKSVKSMNIENVISKWENVISGN